MPALLSSDGESAVLRRLLRLAMAASAPAPWDELGPAARRPIQACYFLLDVDPAGDPETLASEILPRLVRQLTHRTEQRQVESTGRLRGRVVWPATLKARHGRDDDPLRFVCREVRHDFDTLENQLLRFVVERVYECLQAVPEVIRSGACYFSATGGCDVLTIASRLGRIEPALNSFRRHARLREAAVSSRRPSGDGRRSNSADQGWRRPRLARGSGTALRRTCRCHLACT